MIIRFVLVSQFVVGLVLLFAVQSSAEQPSEQSPPDGARPEVFRRQVGEGREIVVTRRPVALGQGLLSPQNERRAKAIYSILVELRTPGTAIPLASSIQWESDVPDTGFSVLDVAAAPGELMLALGIGDSIALWEIHFDSISHESWTPLVGWQVAQLARRADTSTVKVEFTRLPDSRWSAKVTDLRARGAATPAVYERNGTGWQLVQRWQLHAPKE